MLKLPSTPTPAPSFGALPSTVGELQTFVLNMCRGNHSPIQFSLRQRDKNYADLIQKLAIEMRGDKARLLDTATIATATAARDLLMQAIESDGAPVAASGSPSSASTTFQSVAGYLAQKLSFYKQTEAA